MSPYARRVDDDSQLEDLLDADFAAMISASPTCVIVHDAATKNILWANPAACEILEFSLDEIRPLKANDMSSSAQQYDRVIGRAWLQEALEHGHSRIEWHYRSKSGRVIPTDAMGTRVELAHRTVVMVEFRNIERSQQVERELRLTTSYVDALARHTSAMAIMLDRHGTIRFLTDSLLSRLGTAHDLAGPLLTDHARVRIDGSLSSWQAAVARAVPTISLQLEIPLPTGASVWLEGSLERLRDHDEGLLLLLHDATERVEHEVRRELARQQENYQARYNAMGDMAMAIAHELGQPLAAARNYLVGILGFASEPTPARGPAARALPEALSRGIAGALTQIERASSIVSAARMFVGHLEHIDQVVDLNTIVEQCLHFIRLRAVEGWVEVEVNLSKEPVEIRCEPVLTGQVVMNLCFNAVDEMMQAPSSTRRIVITTSARNGEGIFTVDDHGRGLSRDPFEGAFTSKAGGSGIGLALSYRIITRQHGQLWAEKRAEGGTRFGFTLPQDAPTG
jgi:two-component system, LuxR family, sensor kinase FixL